ncbi:MFS transporter [Crossiella sp. CA-258035]|uniref:MFS transporter n=1 Tax=Crossiella sp. CA-258035 TaxID=2981138 RepID=UPI0024BCE87A|nr:MFS transporter [Crossiella sp. CA-258035]WHT17572.1 MFS transporter [Crossiella sp. CA-258035]
MTGRAAGPGTSVAPLVLLEVAAVLSTWANAVLTLALSWLALERTGSPVAAGIIAAASTLPMLLGALFAGTVVDLVGGRRTAAGADLLSAGSVAAIAVLDLAGGFSLWAVAALACTGSLFDLAGMTGRKVLLPAAAGRAGLRLEAVNGIHESLKGVALVAGPALGGLLIGLGGAATALAVAVVAPALAAAGTLLVRLPEQGRPKVAGSALRFAWHGSRQGFAAVWRDPLLRLTALMGATLYLAYLPIASIVLPAYFHAQHAPERLGLLSMTLAAGGIGGAVGYAVLGHRLRGRATFVTAMVASAAGLVAMSFLPPYPALLALAGVVGLASGPISPLTNLATQLRSAPELRGRVMGIMTSAGYVGGPVGHLLGGPLVQRLGPEGAFAVLAGVLFLLVLGASWLPALRGFDRLSATA